LPFDVWSVFVHLLYFDSTTWLREEKIQRRLIVRTCARNEQ